MLIPIIWIKNIILDLNLKGGGKSKGHCANWQVIVISGSAFILSLKKVNLRSLGGGRGVVKITITNYN